MGLGLAALNPALLALLPAVVACATPIIHKTGRESRLLAMLATLGDCLLCVAATDCDAVMLALGFVTLAMLALSQPYGTDTAMLQRSLKNDVRCRCQRARAGLNLV